jgi:hypothetical protein
MKKNESSHSADLLMIKMVMTTLCSWAVPNPSSYLRDPGYKSHDRGWCGFPNSHQANVMILSQDRLWLFPSTSFSFHYSLPILSFDAIWPELFTTSMKRPQTNKSINKMFINSIFELLVIIFKHSSTCRIWGLHSSDYEEYHLLGCDAV